DIARRSKHRLRLQAKARRPSWLRRGMLLQPGCFPLLQPLPGHVSGDSFAAIELLKATANFGVEEVAIFEQPAIQLLLSVKQPSKRLLGRSRTGGLHLLL